jgi:8-oxo-dGTP diphosphatase
MKYDVDYPERRVTLDVWTVTSWSGEPRGLDSQALKWVAALGLPGEDILEADAPIVQRLLSGA